MTVESVINDFIGSIRANYSKAIFTKETKTDKTKTPPVKIEIERAKPPVEKICEILEDANQKIWSAFDITYNSHKYEQGINQNFLVINAYAKSYTAMSRYDHSKSEFYTDDTYAKAAGKMYYSVAKANSGVFLIRDYKAHIDNVTTICDKYEEMYIKFTPNPNLTEDDGTGSGSSTGTKPMIPKITQFWNIHLSAFTAEIVEVQKVFSGLGDKFVQFERNVQSYIDLAEHCAKQLAIGSVFYDEEKYSAAPYGTFKDVWKYVNAENAYAPYSGDVAARYQNWLTTLAYCDILKLDEWEVLSVRSRYNTDVILNALGFWTQAANFETYFDTFVKYL